MKFKDWTYIDFRFADDNHPSNPYHLIEFQIRVSYFWGLYETLHWYKSHINQESERWIRSEDYDQDWFMGKDSVSELDLPMDDLSILWKKFDELFEFHHSDEYQYRVKIQRRKEKLEELLNEE